MPWTSWKFAGSGYTFDHDSDFGNEWSSVASITASGGTSASIAADALPSATYDYLNSDNYGFTSADFGGSTAPTIQGIELEINKYSLNGPMTGVIDSVVRLTKAGALTGSSLANGSAWPGTLTAFTYGSSANLWGTTWTYTDVTSGGFGAGLLVGPPDGSDTAYVDYMRIRIFYSLSNPALSAGFFGLIT